MAREEDLEITDAWREITNADVTEITFLNHGPFPVRIQYQTDPTAPAATDGAGDRYGPGQGERQVSPPSGFDRVFARAVGGRAIVSVRHL